MRNDVHFAALRAAAKVAFSVAFVGGCSAATTLADDETGETTESAYNAKKPSKTVKPPCPTKTKDAGKPSCDAILASAFGDAGAWPTGDEPVSPEVKSCCAEAITKSLAQDPISGRADYHWQCCGATNWGADIDVDGGIGMACTPWGPPVPPAMKKRKAIFLEEPEAWIGVA